MRDRYRIRDAMVFGLSLLLFILIVGCRTQKPVVPQPVILENVTEQSDTIKESYREADIQQEHTQEHISESTTEKITVIITQQGDTVRTDREVTTLRDHWLMIENLRLQATIDSLIFNQTLKEKIEIPVPYPVEVQVEREFTAWEKFRLKAFWWLFGGFVLSAGWNFRKPILTLAKRFIK